MLAYWIWRTFIRVFEVTRGVVVVEVDITGKLTFVFLRSLCGRGLVLETVTDKNIVSTGLSGVLMLQCFSYDLQFLTLLCSFELLPRFVDFFEFLDSVDGGGVGKPTAAPSLSAVQTGAGASKPGGIMSTAEENGKWSISMSTSSSPDSENTEIGDAG